MEEIFCSLLLYFCNSINQKLNYQQFQFSWVKQYRSRDQNEDKYKCLLWYKTCCHKGPINLVQASQNPRFSHLYMIPPPLCFTLLLIIFFLKRIARIKDRFNPGRMTCKSNEVKPSEADKGLIVLDMHYCPYCICDTLTMEKCRTLFSLCQCWIDESQWYLSWQLCDWYDTPLDFFHLLLLPIKSWGGISISKNETSSYQSKNGV